MVEYHFGYGLSMRNDWGLWHGSRLAKQFEDNGIFRPDDMSSLVLDLYWKHLNDLPLDLQESVAKLKNNYLELAATIDSSGVVISDPEDVVPVPDPEKVRDIVLELE